MDTVDDNEQHITEQRLTELEQQFDAEGTIEDILREVYDYGNPDFTPNLAIQIYEELQTQVVLIHAYAEEHRNLDMLTRVNSLTKRVEMLYNILVDLHTFQNSNSIFTLTTEQAILRFALAGDAKEVSQQPAH